MIGPRLRDYLLLLFALGLTGVGALLLVSRPGDRLMTLAITAFFGSLTTFAVWMLLQKRRDVAFSRLADAEVPGGVEILLRRGRMVAVGLVMLAVGALGAVAGWTERRGFSLASGAVAVCGLAFSIALAAGFRRDVYLKFEPAGLRLGLAKCSALFRWDNVLDVRVWELSGNPAVYLLLADPTQPTRDVEALGIAREVAERHVAKSITSFYRWYGCHYAILPANYGLSAVLLAKAIEGYVRDPARRERLALALQLGTREPSQPAP